MTVSNLKAESVVTKDKNPACPLRAGRIVVPFIT